MPLDDEPQLRAHFLRRAMLRPERYLAAALAEWPDADLAAEIAADPVKVWRLRLCGWPREACWAEDVRQLAALVDGHARLLGGLLLEVGGQH
jgi:hypothetical protein